MELSSNEQFWIWLAGFIDGEGCIYIAKTKNSNRWGYQYTLRLEITQANKELLDNIRERVGYGSNTWNKNKSLIGRRQIYAIKWSSRKAYEVLKNVYPYLVVKKAQAKLGMEFQELVNTSFGHGVKVSDEYHNKQVEFRGLLVLAKAP